MKRSIRYIGESLVGLYDKPEIESLAFLILNSITGFTKSQIILNNDYSISDSEFEMVTLIVKRLTHFEPIQYILGKTEFYGLPFLVEPGVLIPRFETEELVDLIVKRNSDRKQLKILDIGTGSGAIAISLKKYLPESEIWCCDISEKAIELTKKNATLNQAEIHIEEYDILGDSPFKEKEFNLLVSNPPYVMEKERALMSSNVLEYEPSIALFVPDHDPLVFYREILHKSHEILSPQGEMFFEINESLGNEIRKLFGDGAFRIDIIKDINGKDRIAHVY